MDRGREGRGKVAKIGGLPAILRAGPLVFWLKRAQVRSLSILGISVEAPASASVHRSPFMAKNFLTQIFG